MVQLWGLGRDIDGLGDVDGHGARGRGRGGLQGTMLRKTMNKGCLSPSNATKTYVVYGGGHDGAEQGTCQLVAPSLPTHWRRKRSDPLFWFARSIHGRALPHDVFPFRTSFPRSSSVSRLTSISATKVPVQVPVGESELEHL